MVFYILKVHHQQTPKTFVTMSKQEIYILKGGYDKDGNFVGLSHKDKHVLDMIRHPDSLSVVFRVTATNQRALPNESEMGRIAHVCPRLVFPLSIKFGMREVSEKTFDLYGFTRGKMASVVYVDEGVEIFWAANKIDMKGQKAVKIEVEGAELIRPVYFLPEMEAVGSDF